MADMDIKVNLDHSDVLMKLQQLQSGINSHINTATSQMVDPYQNMAAMMSLQQSARMPQMSMQNAIASQTYMQNIQNMPTSMYGSSLSLYGDPIVSPMTRYYQSYQYPQQFTPGSPQTITSNLSKSGVIPIPVRWGYNTLMSSDVGSAVAFTGGAAFLGGSLFANVNPYARATMAMMGISGMTIGALKQAYGASPFLGNTQLDIPMYRSQEMTSEIMANIPSKLMLGAGEFATGSVAMGGMYGGLRALAGGLTGAGNLSKLGYGAMGVASGGVALAGTLAHEFYSDMRDQIKTGEYYRDLSAPYIREGRLGGGATFQGSAELIRGMGKQFSEDRFLTRADVTKLLQVGAESGMYEVASNTDQIVRIMDNLGKGIKSLYTIGIKMNKTLETVDEFRNIGIDMGKDPSLLNRVAGRIGVQAFQAGYTPEYLIQASMDSARMFSQQRMSALTGFETHNLSQSIVGSGLRYGSIPMEDLSIYGGRQQMEASITSGFATLGRNPINQLAIMGMFTDKNLLEKFVTGKAQSSDLYNAVGSMDIQKYQDLRMNMAHVTRKIQEKFPEVLNLGLLSFNTNQFKELYGRKMSEGEMYSMLTKQMGLDSEQAESLMATVKSKDAVAKDTEQSILDMRSRILAESHRPYMTLTPKGVTNLWENLTGSLTSGTAAFFQETKGSIFDYFQRTAYNLAGVAYTNTENSDPLAYILNKPSTQDRRIFNVRSNEILADKINLNTEYKQLLGVDDFSPSSISDMSALEKLQRVQVNIMSGANDKGLLAEADPIARELSRNNKSGNPRISRESLEKDILAAIPGSPSKVIDLNERNAKLYGALLYRLKKSPEGSISKAAGMMSEVLENLPTRAMADIKAFDRAKENIQDSSEYKIYQQVTGRSDINIDYLSDISRLMESKGSMSFKDMKSIRDIEDYDNILKHVKDPMIYKVGATQFFKPRYKSTSKADLNTYQAGLERLGYMSIEDMTKYDPGISVNVAELLEKAQTGDKQAIKELVETTKTAPVGSTLGRLNRVLSGDAKNIIESTFNKEQYKGNTNAQEVLKRLESMDSQSLLNTGLRTVLATAPQVNEKMVSGSSSDQAYLSKKMQEQLVAGAYTTKETVSLLEQISKNVTFSYHEIEKNFKTMAETINTLKKASENTHKSTELLYSEVKRN